MRYPIEHSERKALTIKQTAVLDFIQDYLVDHHRPPSMKVISEHFGWVSPNAAQCYLDALRRKGYLEPGPHIKLIGVQLILRRADAA